LVLALSWNLERNRADRTLRDRNAIAPVGDAKGNRGAAMLVQCAVEASDAVVENDVAVVNACRRHEAARLWMQRENLRTVVAEDEVWRAMLESEIMVEN
jgi:hypothetical protein